MYRAMGTILMCGTVSGAVDRAAMSLWGTEGKALEHGVGIVVLGLTVWGLWDQENGRRREERPARAKDGARQFSSHDA